MTSFLSKLLGRAEDVVSPESTGLELLTPEPRRKSARREPPAQLNWSRAEYIPMPPSPPTWEVDGRDDFPS